MQSYVALLVLAMTSSAQVFAQSPANWKVRPDRSLTALDPDAAGAIKFVTMGTGFHATNPQAAVYWNPANSATGAYTLKGAFTLMRPSGHTNYYGLVFGGRDLDGAQQKYTYFVVAQDGTWLVKRRDGSSTSELAGRMANAAVKKPDAGGKSTNALEVRAGADKIDFAVNGVVVHSMPKAGVNTDGIYGIRINHLLEVHIDGFGVSPQ
ncbi:MAG TPA: hypothetical protein VEV17_09385 [Bryobacteraceae bacterium]|nr:hypothetical protein [Bryobacteraceae bacterium]